MSARVVLVLLAAASTSCAIVPQNRRVHMADPIMQFSPDALDAASKQKVYTTREAAAGGDGAAAGGGCGCQ